MADYVEDISEAARGLAEAGERDQTMLPAFCRRVAHLFRGPYLEFAGPLRMLPRPGRFR
jgi:hypothetical protein